MRARRRRRWRIAFWSYVAALASISAAAYLHVLPRDSGLLDLPHADHVIHFLLLGGASFLSHRALGGRWITSRRVSAPLGPLIIGAISILDECFQAFVPWRTFDLLDMASNLSGVLLFGALAEVLIRRALPAITAHPIGATASARSSNAEPSSPTNPAP